MVGTLHAHCLRVLGLIPGWRTKIPQAAWCGQAPKKGKINQLLLKTNTAEELENLQGKDQQSFKLLERIEKTQIHRIINKQNKKKGITTLHNCQHIHLKTLVK